MSDSTSRERRVYLAELDEATIERFLALSHEPELVETMGWKPFEPGETQRFLEQLDIVALEGCGPGRTVVLGIVHAEERRPIGFVCLKGVSETNPKAEIDIAIMDKEYRGAGYGSEALELIAEYGFEQLGLKTIGLAVFPSNVKAIRAYEKAGFSKIKLLEKGWRMGDGELADILLMEKTAR